MPTLSELVNAGAQPADSSPADGFDLTPPQPAAQPPAAPQYLPMSALVRAGAQPVTRQQAADYLNPGLASQNLIGPLTPYPQELRDEDNAGYYGMQEPARQARDTVGPLPPLTQYLRDQIDPSMGEIMPGRHRQPTLPPLTDDDYRRLLALQTGVFTPAPPPAGMIPDPAPEPPAPPPQSLMQDLRNVPANVGAAVARGLGGAAQAIGTAAQYPGKVVRQMGSMFPGNPGYDRAVQTLNAPARAAGQFAQRQGGYLTEGAAQTEQDLPVRGEVGKMAVGLGTLGVDAAVGAVTGGAGFTASFATRAGGTMYDQAIRQGDDPGTATQKAVVAAFTAALTPELAHVAPAEAGQAIAEQAARAYLGTGSMVAAQSTLDELTLKAGTNQPIDLSRVLPEAAVQGLVGVGMHAMGPVGERLRSAELPVHPMARAQTAEPGLTRPASMETPGAQAGDYGGVQPRRDYPAVDVNAVRPGLVGEHAGDVSADGFGGGRGAEPFPGAAQALPAGVREFAQRAAAAGMPEDLAWQRWVEQTNLNPGMRPGQFSEIYGEGGGTAPRGKPPEIVNSSVNDPGFQPENADFNGIRQDVKTDEPPSPPQPEPRPRAEEQPPQPAQDQQQRAGDQTGAEGGNGFHGGEDQNAPAARLPVIEPGATSANGPAPTPEPTAPPARRQAKNPRPFSKTDLERRLVQHYDETEGRADFERATQAEALGDQTGNGAAGVFRDKIPQSLINEFTPREWAQVIRRHIVSVGTGPDHTGGEDAISEHGMGHDRYVQMVKDRLRQGVKPANDPASKTAAIEHARQSPDPEMQLLAAIHDNLRPAKDQRATQVIDPSAQPTGTRFTFQGAEFHIIEGPDGHRLLKDGDEYPVVPADYIDRMPADKGSVRGPEAPAAAEPAPKVEATATKGERIEHAAVRVNGELFTGQTHTDAVEKAEAAGALTLDRKTYTYLDRAGNDPAPTGDMDLFVTDRGRVVSRHEASKIARVDYAIGEHIEKYKRQAEARDAEAAAKPQFFDPAAEGIKSGAGVGIFGQTTFDPATGNRQGTMFHEPVEVKGGGNGESAQDARIRSKFSEGEGATGELIPAEPTNESTALAREDAGGGWTLHLAVDPKNQGWVQQSLAAMGLRFERGRPGDQAGRDFAVHVGHEGEARAVADKINEQFGKFLAVPRVDSGDVSLGGRVAGRPAEPNNEPTTPTLTLEQYTPSQMVVRTPRDRHSVFDADGLAGRWNDKAGGYLFGKGRAAEVQAEVDKLNAAGGGGGEDIPFKAGPGTPTGESVAYKGRKTPAPVKNEPTAGAPPKSMPGTEGAARRDTRDFYEVLRNSLFGEHSFANADVRPTVESAGRTLAEAARDLQSALAPQTRGDDARAAKGSIREYNAELARKQDRATAAMAKARGHFDRLGKKANYDFIDRMERGEAQDTPELTAFARGLRKLLDQGREDVRALGEGKLQSFYEDYFPHIWKDPDGAASMIGRVLGKRPLEGTKSFLKKRTIETLSDGIKAGLKPVSDNPVDLALLKYREMQRYVFAHKVLADLKAQGILRYVPATGKTPEGYVRINDAAATVYGPPTVTVKEYVDRMAYEGLQKVAADLGVRHTRMINAGRGALGFSVQGGNRVVSQFGTGESVLAHELGHQIDHKFGLMDHFFNFPDPKLRAAMKREMRAVADLNLATPENPAGEADPQYRKKGEQVADILMAYVHARPKMEEIAPTVLREFESFIYKHPALRQLRDVQHSLSVLELTNEQAHGGLLKMGDWAAPEAAAQVINNHLSPGLRNRSGLMRAYLGAANFYNGVQLGLSAFHLGMTSIDAATSKLALAIEQAVGGKPVTAARTALRVPLAPLENLLRGRQVMHAWLGDSYAPGAVDKAAGKYLLDPLTKLLGAGLDARELAGVVDATVAAGGRAKMDDFYRTHLTDKMLKAFRQGNVAGGVLRLPLAAFDAAAKPIMEYIVPRQKLGVFADLARQELEKLGPGAKREDVREAMGRAWDSVDNRMGQVVYDNLFWNRTAKDLAMASVRSVGWNLGTIRELGGGAVDTAKAAGKAATLGKFGKPELTHRMAYLAAVPVVAGAIGATLQYLLTGERPKALLDYFYPRTGQTDPDGNEQRLSLPTYMRDVVSYFKHPVQTVGHKFHPTLDLIVSMLENKDFYGTKIVNEDDPLVRRMADGAAFAAKSLTPFGVQGYQRLDADELPGARKALPFVGFSPAPASLTMSKAMETAREIAGGKTEVGGRTKEQADRAALKRDLGKGLKAGKPDAETRLADAQRTGRVNAKDVRDVRERARSSPLEHTVRAFSADEISRVWAAAVADGDAEDLATLRPIVTRKVATDKRMAPADRQAWLAAVRAGKAVPRLTQPATSE